MGAILAQGPNVQTEGLSEEQEVRSPAHELHEVGIAPLHVSVEVRERDERDRDISDAKTLGHARQLCNAGQTLRHHSARCERGTAASRQGTLLSRWG